MDVTEYNLAENISLDTIVLGYNITRLTKHLDTVDYKYKVQ